MSIKFNNVPNFNGFPDSSYQDSTERITEALERIAGAVEVAAGDVAHRKLEEFLATRPTMEGAAAQMARYLQVHGCPKCQRHADAAYEREAQAAFDDANRESLAWFGIGVFDEEELIF